MAVKRTDASRTKKPVKKRKSLKALREKMRAVARGETDASKTKLELLTGMKPADFDRALTKAVGQAAAEAIRENHRAGRATHGQVNGVIGKLNPDGSFDPD